MLSIIVPVYNVSQYISRCMESILCQDGYPYEVILVDDGSTDGSGEICDTYAFDPRVKIFHKENGGTSTARNTGIEAAEGDYLWFVDPDDWVDKQAISIIGREIAKQDMIVFGAYRAIENKDCSIQLQPHYQPKADRVVTTTSETDFLFANCTLWNKVFSREFIGSQRFTNGIRFGQDAEFYYRLIRPSMKVTLLPQMLYYYHINRKGNVVSSAIDERSNDFLDSAITSYNTLKEKGWGAIGIKRINTIIGQVLNKIPSAANVREYMPYIRKCRAVAKYPSWRDKLGFFCNRKIRIGQKAKYLSWLINPWHAWMFLTLKTALRR